MCTISCKVDENVKAQSEAIFESLGLSMSAAINVFLRAAIRENGLPVNTKLGKTYEQIIDERILESKTSNNVSPEFTSVKDAMDWLNA